MNNSAIPPVVVQETTYRIGNRVPRTDSILLGIRHPDIKLLTQCYYHRGTRLNAMKRFLYFQLFLNVLTFFPPDWGMLRRSRCIQIFL